MSSLKFQQLVSSLQEKNTYWHEAAKFEFSVGLDEVMRESKISRADLARALGTSQAYVTKVLRGDTNFTIETMVNVARAAGGELVLKVAPRRPDANKLEEIAQRWKHVPRAENRARRAFEFHDLKQIQSFVNTSNACNDQEDENEPLAA